MAQAHTRKPKETALGAAFVRAGAPPQRDVELSVALAKFRNNGGGVKRAYELVSAAYQLAEQGPPPTRPKGLADDAPAPSAAAEGRSAHADNGQVVDAPAAAAEGGGGHEAAAEQATHPAAPAPRPSLRTAAVIAAAQKPALMAIWDTMKVKDGRPWKAVRYHELEAVRFEHARDAMIARQIQRHVAHPSPPDATVEELVTIETFQRFAQRGAELAEV